jgi:predicted DNA-binding transcriptional regulator AlpA
VILPSPTEQPTVGAPVVAKAYGVSEDVLYQLVRAGEFQPAPRRLGRKLRWITAELWRDLGLEEAVTV